MAVRVKSHHDYSIALEGGEVRLKLARMSVSQFEEFNATFQALSKGRGNPALHAPATDSETADEARAKVAAEVAYLQGNAEWQATVFGAYVHVVEGDLVHEQEDGSEEVITDGARFAELYAAEASDVLAELWLRNALTDQQKKTLLLLRASGTGSTTASNLAASGPRPETTATDAEPVGSAPLADATEPSSGEPSGTTAQSCSEPALSVS
jgi:hypothetical protein